MFKNLQLEKNIFSFTYFQLNWKGGDNNQGGQIFRNLHKLGDGNKLKSVEKYWKFGDLPPLKLERGDYAASISSV